MIRNVMTMKTRHF